MGDRLGQVEGLAMATADPMCHTMSGILRSTPAMSWMNLCWWVAETGLPSLAAADQSRRRSDPTPQFGEFDLLQMLQGIFALNDAVIFLEHDGSSRMTGQQHGCCSCSVAAVRQKHTKQH